MAYKPPDEHLWENIVGQRDDALARIEKHASEMAELAQKHADALTEKDLEKESALAAKDAEIDKLRTTLAEAVSIIEALGGTELGQKMAREKRLAELAAHKAALEAEIAKLGE